MSNRGYRSFSTNFLSLVGIRSAYISAVKRTKDSASGNTRIRGERNSVKEHVSCGGRILNGHFNNVKSLCSRPCAFCHAVE